MTILMFEQPWIVVLKELYLPPHMEILSNLYSMLFLILKLFGNPDNGN